MLCFRRAIREAPQSVDARYHLAEVLWQLGRLPDAIANWTEAAKLAPEHKASHQALCEALLGTGEVSAAAQSASRVLAIEPTNARAKAIVAIAALWSQDDPTAAESLRDALAQNPEWLGAQAIAGSLALLLDRAAERASTATILDALLATGAEVSRIVTMPALLLAVALERLTEARNLNDHAAYRHWIEAALTRPWAIADHDALRRVALAVAALVPEDDAAAVGRLYAAMCARIDRTGAPMMWPRRTPGKRLRIVVLEAESGEAGDARSLIRALPNDDFDVSFVQASRGDLSSRAIADADTDVVVDLVGLSARVGVALAQRPGRRRITIASLRAHHHPPLVDQVVKDAGELVATLERMQAAIEESAPEILDAATTSALWKQAVDAHRSGDRAAARVHYGRFLESQPAFAPAHHLLGVALREDGEVAEARAQFAAALEAAPDYVAARVDAIRIAIDAGDPTAADALARAAPSSDDAPPPLLRAFGAARLAAHDGAAAAEWFERAAKAPFV